MDNANYAKIDDAALANHHLNQTKLRSWMPKNLWKKRINKTRSMSPLFFNSKTKSSNKNNVLISLNKLENLKIHNKVSKALKLLRFFNKIIQSSQQSLQFKSPRLAQKELTLRWIRWLLLNRIKICTVLSCLSYSMRAHPR